MVYERFSLGQGPEMAGLGRLGAFVAAMFIVSLTSGNYAFSVFSGALKHTLNLSQADLDTIAVYPYLAGLLCRKLSYIVFSFHSSSFSTHTDEWK